jgi:uncharacterized protein
MKRRIPFVVAAWLVVDFYFFQAVTTLTGLSYILIAYWLFDITIGACILYFALGRGQSNAISWFMAFMLLSLVPKLVALPVLLIGDIYRLFVHSPPAGIWFSILTLTVAATVFTWLLYGLIGGRHRYKVLRETLLFKDLPGAFDGFTITQVSDIHSGSFSSRKGVEKGVSLVNEQKSDIILFTGDLVNNRAAEMDQWIGLFASLKAPMGKFSILGNHDYGDYIRWKSKADKYANLDRLKKVHAEIGFRLLLNESVKIEKQGQSITLVGVENWGKGRFHKYGDLNKATADVPDDSFKILMSHDPSHWDAVTLDHKKHIHLTLAGHTHGMQFGFEIFGFKWSPVKYIYPQWAGLYEKNEKYLYVNRGFGFLGFKGRVGIWPEITVITLKKE